jgi:hypothetical protein
MFSIESHQPWIEWSSQKERSAALDISEWDDVYDRPKNTEYYAGDRTTKIPLELYPNTYKHGYIYGYYSIGACDDE